MVVHSVQIENGERARAGDLSEPRAERRARAEIANTAGFKRVFARCIMAVRPPSRRAGPEVATVDWGDLEACRA